MELALILVALALAAVMVAAQCQLFVIRRLMERLLAAQLNEPIAVAEPGRPWVLYAVAGIAGGIALGAVLLALSK